MDIPLFSLQTETIGLLLSDDKGYGIWDKLAWGYSYDTAALIQGRKGDEDQPQPLYNQVIGRIKVAVNNDPDNLIVDCMEETYEFILDHQIREMIRI